MSERMMEQYNQGRVCIRRVTICREDFYQPCVLKIDESSYDGPFKFTWTPVYMSTRTYEAAKEALVLRKMIKEGQCGDSPENWINLSGLNSVLENI